MTPADVYVLCILILLASIGFVSIRRKKKSTGCSVCSGCPNRAACARQEERDSKKSS